MIVQILQVIAKDVVESYHIILIVETLVLVVRKNLKSKGWLND